MNGDNKDLRYFILNYQEPLIFKNMIEWSLLSWNLKDWQNIIGAEHLKYRLGVQKYTQTPQWENKCEFRESTFSNFLQYTDENPERFAYFDYKHLAETFENIKELQNGISWKSFGFPEYAAKKSTIWIGSKGAHTPCHKDTYGCNLVAQVYGRKLWMLFPPEENLCPTRVPYEESSIFSKLNFYSPNLKKCKGFSKCRTVILNPGDVLLVPHGWWHYVENLDTAISVNVWLEREDDIVKQLDESLIQFFIGRIFGNMNEEQKSVIMNPSTDLTLLAEQISLNTSLSIIDVCRNNYLKRSNHLEHSAGNTHFNDRDLLEKHKDIIEFIPVLSQTELDALLSAQNKRFPISADVEGEVEDDILCKLIDAFTSENVINLVKSNLLCINK